MEERRVPLLGRNLSQLIARKPFEIAWSFWVILFTFIFSSCGCGLVRLKAFEILFVLSGWILSTILHEFAHAYTALLGGDHSIKDKGYLDLDLFKYTGDIINLLIPILVFCLTGYFSASPYVLIQTSNIRSNKWQTATALAGPLVNLAFALTAYILYQNFVQSNSSPMEVSLMPALWRLSITQLITALYNLIPLPPFDGWNALSPWLLPTCFLKKLCLNPWHYKSISMVVLLSSTFVLFRLARFA